MKYAYPPKPHRMSKKPTIFQSLIPILTLIGLIGLNVTLLGDDTLSGANQMSLLIASGVAACIAFYNRKHWNDILKGILHTLTGAIPAILILLMIGVLAGTWMLSGIIPAMIHYGLYILRPDYFLPAAVVISAVISVATGSSWSTVATVGVALLGIGQRKQLGQRPCGGIQAAQGRHDNLCAAVRGFLIPVAHQQCAGLIGTNG